VIAIGDQESQDDETQLDKILIIQDVLTQPHARSGQNLFNRQCIY